mgnify:CR=1 FL=1
MYAAVLGIHVYTAVFASEFTRLWVDRFYPSCSYFQGALVTLGMFLSSAVLAETMTDLNSMDSPQSKREEIVAIYGRSGMHTDVNGMSEGETLQEEIISDTALEEAKALTNTIRTTLQHAYHFLGDMIISQVIESYGIKTDV